MKASVVMSTVVVGITLFVEVFVCGAKEYGVGVIIAIASLTLILGGNIVALCSQPTTPTEENTPEAPKEE